MPDLVRPFSVGTELLKAVEENGEWVVSGPITPKGEDYDGDIIDDAAVKKGLTFFDRLGQHVDWAHMYNRTKNPKFLIGKGVQFRGPDGRTWLKTVLDKSNEIAQELWKKATSPDGFSCGYSLEGLLKERHPDDSRRIVDTEIHRITIDPSPKGYGNHLQVGVPDGSFAGLAKAVAGELADNPTQHGWIPENEFAGFDAGADMAQMLKAVGAMQVQIDALVKAVVGKGMDDGTMTCSACGQSGIPDASGMCPSCGASMDGGADMKALTSGGPGIVQDGQTGGGAMRMQCLVGAGEQARCAACGAKNADSRTTCRKCGHSLAERSVKKTAKKAVPDALAKALETRGVANAAGLAQLIRNRR